MSIIKTANRDVSEESWVSHLGFIQNVVTRMAQNSYLLKGWTVTLVAAIFALSLSLDSALLIGVSFLPTFVFAVLDAYYLRQERLFRKLYDEVRKKPENVEAFSMKTNRYSEKTVAQIVWTISIWPFYLAIVVAIFLGIVIASANS